MTQTKTRRYACAHCGKKDSAEKMSYSRHTGNRFCIDWGACDRRRKRSKRA